MKQYYGFELTHKDAHYFQHTSGVTATEKKQYWNQSPWNAFRLLLKQL